MIFRFLSLLSSFLLLVSCDSDVPDYAASKALVLQAQEHFSSGNYSALEALFSEDFVNGESSASRNNKFDALNKVLGAPVSISVLDSSVQAKPGEIAGVNYSLSSKNQKINSINRFFVIKEGGTHKIAMIDIQAVQQ